METLPVEIVHQIAAYLDIGSSLRFALTSIYIYDAVVYLYKHKWKRIAINRRYCFIRMLPPNVVAKIIDYLDWTSIANFIITSTYIHYCANEFDKTRYSTIIPYAKHFYKILNKRNGPYTYTVSKKYYKIYDD